MRNAVSEPFYSRQQAGRTYSGSKLRAVHDLPPFVDKASIKALGAGVRFLKHSGMQIGISAHETNRDVQYPRIGCQRGT
jgi:hypothetical protein